jgi:Skp family chaperone for outer membrane proteins
MNEFELIENVEVKTLQPEPEQKSKKCSFSCNKLCTPISLGVLFVAVIVLYVLHFTTSKSPVFFLNYVVGEPGSGEIVFVNLDTINEHYELVKILTGDIKDEMTKQEAIFTNKENSFQRRYKQFQENVASGVLTQVQMENSQNQLAQEYQQLEADKERIFSSLQTRQAEALLQIYDSLQAAVRRINLQRNASFVLSYQSESPFILATDPAKDITDYVLYELNRTYKK